MKTVIVVAEIPTVEGKDKADMQKKWHELLPRISKKIEQFQGIRTLGENVWLLDAETNASFLVWLLQTLNGNWMKCQISFIEEPLKWIDVSWVEP